MGLSRSVVFMCTMRRVPSRRNVVLRSLAGAGLSVGIVDLPDLAEEGKARVKRRRRRKNAAKMPEPNEFGCLEVGAPCTSEIADSRKIAAFAAEKEIIMTRLVQYVLALGLVVSGLVAAGTSSLAAPPAPQPVTLPCATNMSIQMLGNTEPAAAEGQTLVLVRAIFGPGGGIGPHTHPGTLVISVESGAFGFTVEEEGEMMVMRSGDAGTPAAAEPMAAGQEVVLNPGDWVVEAGMVHSARTVGDEPVQVVFSGLVEAGQPLTTCVD